MRIMPRPFTRAQALQNAAFLAILRRTGNVRATVREMGAHRALFTRRRASHPAFAAEWDAALVIAHARLQRAPDPSPAPAAAAESVPEPKAIRTRNGRLQLRAHRKGQLTRAAEQAFLAALSATANVRLSAAAAGFSHATFYARAKAHPGFAREMRLALQCGYDRVEGALLDSFDVAAARDDGWRHNDLPPVAQVTGDHVIQLLALHHKAVRLWATRPDYRRRRGETGDQQSARMALQWQAERARDAEDDAIARTALAEPARRDPHEHPPAILPALDQVTGWSKADPARTPRRPGRGIAGGWRIGDWEGGGR